MTVTNVVRYGLPSNPAQPFWCYSGGMASLTLKDIPRSLHEQLRERAARHRRSLSQEALATGLTLAELRSRSFVKILKGRRAGTAGSA